MENVPPAIVSRATAEALELPSLLAVLAELAATDLGRERIVSAEPYHDHAEFVRHRRRYEEAAVLLAERRLVGHFEEPLGSLLEDLGSGRSAAVGLALVRLLDLLQATKELSERLAAADPPLPHLGALAKALPDLSTLAQKIGRTLDRRGEVREDASPKLAALRGRVRSLRESLYQDLRRVVETERESLSEDTIPMRGGRLVLVLSSGARGRVAGLVHGRSGTGKSFYFEPLSVVESNNNLQQASEDEEAERLRILNELLAEARARGAELRDHADFLGEMDRLQALLRFAERARGHLADDALPGELVLVGARHPLIDPALADLRAQALGQSGHVGAIVPLDLSFESGRRALIVTGPNAGGKTVVLKSVGLLGLMHLCGFPVPAEPGTRLPFLERLVATVGDEQDLLNDRSTFSGRLMRLKEAWEQAGPASLILVDELGSGTDPEEGAALAISLLEGLLERRALTILTTHLTPLAAAALEMPGAGCAAMEFDPASGRPTYHLQPGPPGGSEALALARRLGLPADWIDRAEARLGSEHRDLRRLLAELERVRVEVREERDRLQREADSAAAAAARLEREHEALEVERKSVGRKLKTELDAFRADTRRRLRDEVARLREEFEGGRKKGLEAAAEERLFAEAPMIEVPETAPEVAVEVGGIVRHRGLGWEGTLEKLIGGKAEVLVRGKRVRVAEGDLAGVRAAPGSIKAPVVSSRSRRADLDGPGISLELNLIGQRVEPALEQLDVYLDQALLGGVPEVRIVHGHGTGRLRDAVREHLRRHPAAEKQRPGAPDEGGNGATVVSLRGSA